MKNRQLLQQNTKKKPLIFAKLTSLGLVHTCRQNRELVSTDKVLRLFIDKLQVWTHGKKFQIMLDLFRNSLQTKSAVCLLTIADFVYKCVLSFKDLYRGLRQRGNVNYE